MVVVAVEVEVVVVVVVVVLARQKLGDSRFGSPRGQDDTRQSPINKKDEVGWSVVHRAAQT